MVHRFKHPAYHRKLVGGTVRHTGMKYKFAAGKMRWVHPGGYHRTAGGAIPGATSHSPAVKGSLFYDNQVSGAGYSKGNLMSQLTKAFSSWKGMSHPRRRHRGGMINYL